MDDKIIKVLVIDDNQDSLVIIRELVHDAFPDCKVSTVSGGREGIALAGVEDPDVIFLDIMMPEMDGFAVCTVLKADIRLCDIPVVFLTAITADKENRIRALEAGADGFLNKPIDEIELAAQLRAMVKIKAAHAKERGDKELLTRLVNERTETLESELAERKRAEAALLESEERYRRITEGITDYLYSVRIANGAAVSTVHSSACEKVTGYTPEEFVKDSFLWITMIPDEERKPVILHVKEILKGKHTAPIEHRIIRKDGVVRWISDTAILNKDVHGNLVSYEGVVRDITDRKKLDDAQTFLLQCGQPGTGEGFFHTLARYLACNLNMEFVCINRLESDGTAAHTVAVFKDGMFDGNMTYILQGTPCNEVVGKRICCYPDDVCRLFPRAGMLHEMRAESYIGTTLWSFDGKPIGIISVVGRAVLKNPVFAENLLKLVAIRAAGELERTQAEEELRFRNSLLSAQQEVSIDGILVIDEYGMILSYNSRFVEMWGIPPEVLASRSDEHVSNFMGKQLACPELFFGKVRHLSGHPREESHDELVLTQGKIFDRYSVPVYGPLNRYYGRIWYFRDITERKRFEDKLVQSERRFRAVFENSPIGIAIIDSESGRIIDVNPRFAAIAGRSVESLEGVDRLSINHPDDIQDDLDNMALMNAAKISGFAMKKRYIRPDGSHVWINMTVAPMNAEDPGKPRHLCMVEDITEMRSIEARLRQSEKMEAIGQLAGGIAHDFNNVLGGIVGYTDMSLDLAEKGSMLDKNLRKVLKAADRAKNLVQQILTFSRQGGSKKTVTVIHPIVNEVVELLKASIPSSVTIVSNLETDTKPVFADPTQIHEMILNLATNAVHAMQRKGVMNIHVYTAKITRKINGRIGAILPGEYAVVEVVDSGCGMDAQTLNKAFDPFFTTKPVGEGTGMGLSVVLGIVQAHNGDLQVESEPGTGTIFRIFLPVTDDTASGADSGKRSAPCKGTEKILFVDDEKTLVEVAKEQLGNLGYTVTGMTNSVKALKFLTKNSADIDFLITDQTMPGLTGAELAEAALTLRGDLPVILCTGYSSEINEAQAIKTGIRRMLLKPLRGYELAVTIREVLDNTSGGGTHGAHTRH